jgi:hypothetical protein
MPGMQKSSGGARKIGNHKEHCARYKQMGIRLRNKLRNFKKHNLPKDIDEITAKKLIGAFEEIQKNRQRG